MHTIQTYVHTHFKRSIVSLKCPGRLSKDLIQQIIAFNIEFKQFYLFYGKRNKAFSIHSSI